MFSSRRLSFCVDCIIITRITPPKYYYLFSTTDCFLVYAMFPRTSNIGPALIIGTVDITPATISQSRSCTREFFRITSAQSWPRRRWHAHGTLSHRLPSAVRYHLYALDSGAHSRGRDRSWWILHCLVPTTTCRRVFADGL